MLERPFAHPAHQLEHHISVAEAVSMECASGYSTTRSSNNVSRTSTSSTYSSSLAHSSSMTNSSSLSKASSSRILGSSMLWEGLLPPPAFNDTRPTLVLDLDGTLIGSDSNPRCGSPVGGVDSMDVLVPSDMPGVQPLWERRHIWIRPHASEFLAAVKPHFEVVLWTASNRAWADKVLKKLDPHDRIFEHRLYDEHTLRVPLECGAIKDLKLLGRDMSRVVLVEDSVQAVLASPQNSIWVSSWQPNQRQDDVLLAVLRFIMRQVLPTKDVRVPLAALHRGDHGVKDGSSSSRTTTAAAAAPGTAAAAATPHTSAAASTSGGASSRSLHHSASNGASSSSPAAGVSVAVRTTSKSCDGTTSATPAEPHLRHSAPGTVGSSGSRSSRAKSPPGVLSSLLRRAGKALFPAAIGKSKGKGASEGSAAGRSVVSSTAAQHGAQDQAVHTATASSEGRPAAAQAQVLPQQQQPGQEEVPGGSISDSSSRSLLFAKRRGPRLAPLLETGCSFDSSNGGSSRGGHSVAGSVHAPQHSSCPSHAAPGHTAHAVHPVSDRRGNSDTGHTTGVLHDSADAMLTRTAKNSISEDGNPCCTASMAMPATAAHARGSLVGTTSASHLLPGTVSEKRVLRAQRSAIGAFCDTGADRGADGISAGKDHSTAGH